MTFEEEIAGIKGSFEDINSFMDYCYNQERARMYMALNEEKQNE